VEGDFGWSTGSTEIIVCPSMLSTIFPSKSTAPKSGRSLRGILLLGCGLLSIGAPRLMAEGWQELTDNSPFGQAAARTVAPAQELEFRAVLQENGAFLVNLYLPVTNTTQWIPVHGSDGGIEVQSYDPDSDQLHVIWNGKPLTLALKQAKVAFAANVAPPPVPVATPANAATPADRRTAEIRALIEARRHGVAGRAGPRPSASGDAMPQGTDSGLAASDDGSASPRAENSTTGGNLAPASASATADPTTPEGISPQAQLVLEQFRIAREKYLSNLAGGGSQ
jgi:hypothetical protein